MKKALFFLCFLSGCATTPAPMEQQAAIGGAAGCFAHGVAAAADSGKGELIVIGIALMPLCAMLASNNPERFDPQYPWGYAHVPKARGRLVSRK